MCRRHQTSRPSKGAEPRPAVEQQPSSEPAGHIEKNQWRVPTHRLGSVEAVHADVAALEAAEVQQVNGGTEPQVAAGQQQQDAAVEAGAEVWVGAGPCSVPVLVRSSPQTDRQTPQTDRQTPQTDKHWLEFSFQLIIIRIINKSI